MSKKPLFSDRYRVTICHVRQAVYTVVLLAFSFLFTSMLLSFPVHGQHHRHTQHEQSAEHDRQTHHEQHPQHATHPQHAEHTQHAQHAPLDRSELEALFWQRLEESRQHFVQADVDFMSDMIVHHAQALIMSRLSPENGASAAVQRLSARIINAQQDEIALMQQWLRDRGQTVPIIHFAELDMHVSMETPAGAGHVGEHGHGVHDSHHGQHGDQDQHGDHGHDGQHGQHGHHGHNHDDMVGMLSQAQMEELAAARGSEYDRLFLTYMIEHHEGAVYMVNELFMADGAGTDLESYRLAVDIYAEQVTEIAMMRGMLNRKGFPVPDPLPELVEQQELLRRPAASTSLEADMPAQQTPQLTPISRLSTPTPDPRVGLAPGLFDAGEAIWNMRMISTRPSPEDFIGNFNTDLAFKEHYAIQGNYNGVLIWDISDPANPVVVSEILCPASQSDVSVYGDLLFISGEGLEGRLDCGTQGVSERVSADRLRGIRIFDISDMHNPEYVADVQTCRGSHTHSVLVDPNDSEHIYVYVSGSAPVRPEEELPGCSAAFPDEDPESALFRIEVIQVPLANPELARIVSSPRIFDNLEAPPVHGHAPTELALLEEARARGGYIAMVNGTEREIRGGWLTNLLKEVASENDRETPTAADSLQLRDELQKRIDVMMAARGRTGQHGPNQCHDITLFPETGLAGGACEGYGILLDIRDPVHPVRLDAVADSNFAYWHSATFNNDGTVVVFTDEWGGGTQAKCRDSDPMEWGANAIFTIENGKMVFQSYFKMPAPQTHQENCVAHNGSLIPVPGRDIMVQGWYQGGVNIFDFTDPANPVEMAFHDRGPITSERLIVGGSWSIYWYNGLLVNSEIARGLDIFEMIPSEYITQNEIDAANTVVLQYFNPQGQPKFVWPASKPLVRAYLDQLERNRELDMASITAMRSALTRAESLSGNRQSEALQALASEAETLAARSGNARKVAEIARVLRELAG